jgi:hypothetical protein
MSEFIPLKKRNNSLNGDVLNKQKIWFFNYVLPFKLKKRIPFKLKPTPLKNWEKNANFI